MKKALSITGIVTLILGLVYLAGVGYYSDRYVPNTKYLSVNISNLTFDQAKTHLEQEIKERELTLQEKGQTVKTIHVKDLNPQVNAQDVLKEIYLKQNPNLWFNFLTGMTVNAEGESEQDKEIQTIHLDTHALADELNQTQSDRKEAVDAKIEYDENQGYHSVPGETGTVIDSDRLEELIIKHIGDGSKSVIDIEEAYQQPAVNEDSPAIKDTLNHIDKVIHANMKIDFGGEEVTLEPEQVQKWLYFDNTNKMVLDDESVKEFLTDLSDKHGTFNKTRKFKSTMQGTVDVPPGILGWGIDIDQELPNFEAAITSGEGGMHKPLTVSTGGVAGAKDDIGDTYVEIDLSYQMMFLYVKGELVLSTDIVSGQIGAETVAGANCVNEMLSPTNLVGFNQFYNVRYSTPVEYWIRFDNNAQGIHDASWQGSFGGNTYQWSGSLGCINTPYDAVKQIYETVTYGTPVIVFY